MVFNMHIKIFRNAHFFISYTLPKLEQKSRFIYYNFFGYIFLNIHTCTNLRHIKYIVRIFFHKIGKYKIYGKYCVKKKNSVPLHYAYSPFIHGTPHLHVHTQKHAYTNRPQHTTAQTKTFHINRFLNF